MFSCSGCCTEGRGEGPYVLGSIGDYMDAPSIKGSSYFVDDESGDESDPENQPWMKFDVTITKGPSGLGMDLSPHDGRTLLVGKIREGPVMQWNRQKGPWSAECVRSGDRVVEVNRVSDNAEKMLASMRGASTLNITFQRMLLFTVPVQRTPGHALGLFVHILPTSLSVTRVAGDSVLDQANRSRAVELMSTGDEIYDINGVKGNGQAMFRVLSSAPRVTMKVRRARVEAAGKKQIMGPEVGC